MIAKFQSVLRFEDDGGFPFILTAPLVYDSGVLGRTLTVPTGFHTDLASIPQVLQSILSPIGKYDAGAVIHDYLYRNNGVTRHQADRVLNEAMELLGVHRWQRWMIYSGIVSGGWVVWNHYRSFDHLEGLS